MARDEKQGLDSDRHYAVLETQKDRDEWLKARQDTLTRFRLVIESYVKKLGNADWHEISQIRENQDWAEAKRQVKLIWHRLYNELQGDESLSANRERMFLKGYVRALLACYEEGGPSMPGLPPELIAILRDDLLAAQN